VIEVSFSSCFLGETPSTLGWSARALSAFIKSLESAAAT
jgi:hypothetical protein